MSQEALVVISSLVLVSCGGAIPFPYPQTAPIPPYSGRVHGWGADGASVEVQGHPETRTRADKNGNFTTREGSDFYFGMDQAYFSKAYRLTASTNGKIHKSRAIERPPWIGRYEGQPDHKKPIGLGDLR
jgi:hypothetical protein